MIRYARHEDISTVVSLLERFSNSSGFSGEYCKTSMRDFALKMMESDDGLLIVNDEVTAIMGALLSPVYFNRNHKTCTELFWYSEKPGDGMRLLKVLEDWAHNNSCKTIHMTSLEVNTGVENIYERKGYKRLETVYCKEL